MATAVTPAHDGGFQFITTLPNQTISVEASPVAVAAHASGEFQRQGVDVLPSGERALSVLDSDVDLVSKTLHTKYHCGWSRGEEEQPGRTIAVYNVEFGAEYNVVDYAFDLDKFLMSRKAER